MDAVTDALFPISIGSQGPTFAAALSLNSEPRRMHLPLLGGGMLRPGDRRTLLRLIP